MIKKRFKLREKINKNIQCDEISDNEEWVTYGEIVDLLNNFVEENKQLKQDNTGLMKLLKNQSIIVQELHSKLLEHHVKEPIILTKEDLELMGKAVSYYTHGRCVE